MFTGIIEEIGTLKSIRHGSRSSRLTIQAGRIMEDIRIGDSISTNGICLTVTSFSDDQFTVDVMPETLRQTSLGNLRAGSRLNLERALKLSDRLGGHLVSGHIDGTGTISEIRTEDNAIWITVSAKEELLRYMIDRGSVALDGVSLTIVRADDRSFRVSIIPHTQTVTTLTSKKTGDLLNIECDMIAKYVEKLFAGNKTPARIDLEFLDRYDFR